MTVVGIDIGNAFCVVAAVLKGGVDVILNEESKRETPTCVAIGERQRFLGAAAASSPPGSTAVSQIKRLIGRPLDEALRNELKALFPNLDVSEDAQGYPLIHFKYRNNELKLNPTQLLGKLLGSLKRSTERHLSAPVSDCCIAVPAHFNDVQRRAVLHAAEIAGLRVRRLIHESSAAALEYGLYRDDLPANASAPPHVIAFVDVGHSSTQVAIARFRTERVRILARVADPNLGGRDFDEKLFDHFKDKFIADDPKLDVSRSARAAARLRATCEKVKKVLSANPEAPLHIECFMEDKDVSGLITRQEFETICMPLLEKLESLLEKALAHASARLSGLRVNEVELIGSGSRVPAVVGVVSKVFGREPRRTLNASECVARGCALQAAVFSPALRVKPFKIREDVPFPIRISPNSSVLVPPQSQLFTKEDQIPTPKVGMDDQIPAPKVAMFTTKVNALSFDLLYGDSTENQDIGALCTYHVGPFNTQDRIYKLKVTIKLNDNGIVSVDSVTGLPCIDDGSPMETNEASPHLLRTDMGAVKPGKMHDARSARLLNNGSQNHNSIPKINHHTSTVQVEIESSKSIEDLAEDTSMMDIDNKPSPLTQPSVDAEELEKISNSPTEIPDVEHSHSEARSETIHKMNDGKSNRTTLATHLAKGHSEEEEEIQIPFLEDIRGVLSTEDLRKARQWEIQMTDWDREVEMTKDRKNALESYVYEMRNKLSGKYKEFVLDADRKSFLGTLRKAEEWLYDQGEDVGCDTYDAKLKALKKVSDPIETRFRENSERESVLQQLVSFVTDLSGLANGSTTEFGIVDRRQRGKEKYRNLLKQAETLRHAVMEVDGRPKYEDPRVTVDKIRSSMERLDRELAVVQLEIIMRYMEDLANGIVPEYARIGQREKQQIRVEHDKAVKLCKQASLKDSVVTAAEIRMKTENLMRFCEEISLVQPVQPNPSFANILAKAAKLPILNRWLPPQPRDNTWQQWQRDGEDGDTGLRPVYCHDCRRGPIYCDNCDVMLRDRNPQRRSDVHYQQQPVRHEYHEEETQRQRPFDGPYQQRQHGNSNEMTRPGSDSQTYVGDATQYQRQPDSFHHQLHVVDATGNRPGPESFNKQRGQPRVNEPLAAENNEETFESRQQIRKQHLNPTGESMQQMRDQHLNQTANNCYTTSFNHDLHQGPSSQLHTNHQHQQGFIQSQLSSAMYNTGHPAPINDLVGRQGCTSQQQGLHAPYHQSPLVSHMPHLGTEQGSAQSLLEEQPDHHSTLHPPTSAGRGHGHRQNQPALQQEKKNNNKPKGGPIRH